MLPQQNSLGRRQHPVRGSWRYVASRQLAGAISSAYARSLDHWPSRFKVLQILMDRG